MKGGPSMMVLKATTKRMRQNDRKIRQKVFTFVENTCRMFTQTNQNVKRKEVHMTKAVNYTPEMVSEMAAQTPLNLEKAQALSIQLNRSVRSIIAKAKREGIDYVSVKPVAKRVKGQTKAQMVEAITEKLNADSLDGLEKAPALALGRLLECL